MGHPTLTTRADLIEKYRDLKADAERFGYHADAAELFECVIQDLEQLDGFDDEVPRLLTTEEAGERLGVERATVAKYCRNEELPEISKTGSDGGEWRIPASSLTKLQSAMRVSAEDDDGEPESVDLDVDYEEERVI